jgi:hypothetical protein
MMTIIRTLAGCIVAIGGLVACALALWRHGSFVALLVLLLCEGLAALLVPNLGDE